jgi:transcriptional regulator with XRE-family HTH domain
MSASEWQAGFAAKRAARLAKLAENPKPKPEKPKAAAHVPKRAPAPTRKPGKVLGRSRLERERNLSGLTAEHMSEVALISVPDYEALEHGGRRLLSDEQRRAIANALAPTLDTASKEAAFTRQATRRKLTVADLWKPDGQLVPAKSWKGGSRMVVGASWAPPLETHLVVSRRKARLSLPKAAAAVEIPREEMDAIEQGFQLADPVTAERLAGLYQVPLSDLFSATLLALPTGKLWDCPREIEYDQRGRRISYVEGGHKIVEEVEA